MKVDVGTFSRVMIVFFHNYTIAAKCF